MRITIMFINILWIYVPNLFPKLLINILHQYNVLLYFFSLNNSLTNIAELKFFKFKE